MPKYFYEDFIPESVDHFGPRPVTREEIVAFAAQFDPQPMHLDEEAARHSMLGGLAASGWHSCAIIMRMLCDWFLLETDGWGGPGIDEVRWLKPVRPGDQLTLTRKVLEKRVSKSRPEMGLVKFHYTLSNQAGEAVATMVTPIMIGLRAAHAEARSGVATP
ncbi:MAG: MaoC family dehydratase [Variibacter sp.]|nr:MaoC family dehydratase [Variibacter sp.]